jgi:hypothetical protein
MGRRQTAFPRCGEASNDVDYITEWQIALVPPRARALAVDLARPFEALVSVRDSGPCP